MKNRKTRTWGIRTGHGREIAAKIISYLQAQPVGIDGSSEGWGRGWVHEYRI